MTVRKDSTTKAIKDILKIHCNATIPDRQIQRARAEIVGLIQKEMAHDYNKIPDYFARLKANQAYQADYDEENIAPGGPYTDTLYEDDGTFKRAFMMPMTKAYGGALPFVAFDGTYVRNCYHQTLLTATGRDGNKQIFLYAWV